MLALLLNLLLLVSACIAIHSVGMLLGIRWLQHLWPRRDANYVPARTFGLIVSVVYGLLLLHLLQILVWAMFYQFRRCFTDFSPSFYFSTSSYSTLGYGDVILTGRWRIFGAIEAVIGILFTVVHHLLSHSLRKSGLGQNPS